MTKSIPSLSAASNLQAMGDKLLEEALAIHEQIPVLVRQARKLEYEAFAYYARTQAIEEARKIVAAEKSAQYRDPRHEMGQ